MRLSRQQSNAAKVLAVMLSATSIAGCQTVTSSTETRAQCAAWRSISYSAKKDTTDTVRQVRVHNRTGQNLGCWE